MKSETAPKGKSLGGARYRGNVSLQVLRYVRSFATEGK